MKLRLLFFSLFLCSAGLAQDFIMKKKLADSYFNYFTFYKAIPMYEQLVRSYPQKEELYEKLATSYDRINDSQNAEKYYAVLAGKKGAKPEYLLDYARTLARNGKYEQSRKWYASYRDARPEDPRGTMFAEAYANMDNFYRDSSAFTINKCPFSSPADDFSPAYFGSSIVFSSNREGFSAIRSNYNWTRSPYLDLYVAHPGTADAKPFSRELNSPYHEGPVTFNATHDTIIFTRSNYFRARLHKSNEGINKLSLFQANWDARQGKWVNVHPLALDNDEYSVEHPALSPDGHALYFASDMPGGMGGMDLYVSYRITDSRGEQSWGVPVNLGPGINTPGQDIFPFVDNEGNLWYASNGLPGLGGLDIFFAAKSKEGFAKPVNPGYPLNTRFDDFGYITQNGGKEGYFSSDRNNPVGDDDIYRVSRSFRKLFVRVVDAKTGRDLAATRLTVSEENGGSNSTTNENSALYSMELHPYHAYRFETGKTKYQTAVAEYSAAQLKNQDTLTIALTSKQAQFGLSGRIFAADDHHPVEGANITLINQSTSTQSTLTSDGKGGFSGELLPGSDYLIRTVVPGKCKAEPVGFSTKGMERDSTFQLQIPVYCAGNVIRLGDIYYDLNRYNIRPDAAKVLDKLLSLLNEYPKMKIELRSHTDSRGTVESNRVLSENRAKAVAGYLYSKGIARNRIVSKGYGESMLLNKCAKGVVCSEEEHQLNRRTEFKILSVE